VTFAQRGGLSLVATLAWRYAIGAALLFLMAGPTRRAMVARRGLMPLVVLGVMQALVAALSLSALAWISAATLGFLFYTYPAWIAVLAAVRKTERLTVPRIVALVLALAGIAVMVGTPGPGEVHPIGIALALTSALLYAVYVPILAHYDREHGGPATATYGSAGAAIAIVAGAVAFPRLTGGLHMPPGITAWAAIVFLAVFATAIGFLAFLRGLAVIGPVRAAIVSTVEPFFTATLAALLLGQPLTLATLAGGVCVAAAVVLLQRAHENAKAELRRALSTELE
jgi:drug/metabolite transporter (DMT)-like permease